MNQNGWFDGALKKEMHDWLLENISEYGSTWDMITKECINVQMQEVVIHYILRFSDAESFMGFKLWWT